MSKKTIIGHIVCPCCGFQEAQVKEDKNGHAYAHCTDCNAQLFTRNDHRDAQLRKRMTPVTVTVTVTEPEPAKPAPAKPVTAPAPAAKAAPKAPAPAPATAANPAKVPTEAPKKSGWLTPIMAGA